MTDAKTWERKAHVTEGADPTEVVTWTNGDFEIVEFQDVYGTRVSPWIRDDGPNSNTTHYDGPVAALGRELHKALEQRWYEEQMSAESDWK